MAKEYILAIDQGTTGSRAFIFDRSGKGIASSYEEFKQYFPKPGWVEHDAEEIWQSTLNVIGKAIRLAKIKSTEIKAIGITNQRETTVLWDRKTSKPVGHAIVWQCRRTTEICNALKKKGLEKIFKKKTGLVLDPYFSGTKIAWYLQQNPSLYKKAKQNNLCFGTIDSWLMWKLTGGKSHVTDYTNASRTLIFNIKEKKWDNQLLKILKIPSTILPKVQASGSVFGETASSVKGLTAGIPILSVMGDQQAALYGQGCYAPGELKNTYGTGCFVVLNTGKRCIESKHGLLSTLACDDAGKPVYALEGSIFIGGAVMQWLRDQLGFFKNTIEADELIKNVRDTNGVYIVPAFAGLGAPYWDSAARGIMCGLTRGANRAHIIRAARESIAYQTKDVVDVMRKELGAPLKALKVDGGACRSNFLMQFQSDMLNVKIIRPQMIDSTVFGVALLAGVMLGWWNKRDLHKLEKQDKIFVPRMSVAVRNNLYQGWLKAVEKAKSS